MLCMYGAYYGGLGGRWKVERPGLQGWADWYRAAADGLW